MATIIFKPTEGCNARCLYCDVVTRRPRSGAMSLELLTRVFHWIDEYLRAAPQETVSLVWHGGEPLLLGPAYFRSAWSLQKQVCAGTMERITHAVQTNLTLLDAEMIEALKEMGIRTVGTSYEPLPGIRGIGPTADWREYDRRFFEGMRLVRENGFGWGLIYVVTRRALAMPSEIFLFLTNLALSNGFQFNPVLLYGEDTHGLRVTPEEYAEFLGAIFPLWWQHRERWPHVEPFSRYERAIVRGHNAPGCADSGRCHRSHVYVGPRGELSLCGRAADWGIVSYGSISDRSLRAVLDDSSAAQPLARRIEILRGGDCRDCRFWELCHGGCPLDSFPAHGDLLHKSEWCASQRIFLEKYFEPVTGARFNG